MNNQALHNVNNTLICCADITSDWFANHLCYWQSLLNSEEKARFDAFKTKQRQQQFLLGRVLLAYSVNQLNESIKFAHYEMPNFNQIRLGNNLFYKSISHANNLVVVALSSVEHNLGIDIEAIKDRDFKGLSDEYFCSQEVNALDNVGWTAENFYRLWTAKEAYTKVTQSGISHSLSLNFSKLLAAPDEPKTSEGVECQRLYFYQHNMGNHMLSIATERASSIFSVTPIMVHLRPDTLQQSRKGI